MRNLITLFLFLFTQQISFGQNLVPNGDFEQYSICPNPDQITKCVGWQSATTDQSDYFNSCSSMAGVPYNVIGHQPAYNGNAYAGICMYVKTTERRNYLLREIAPLEIGSSYRVSLQTSLADASIYFANGLSVFFYMDGIGCDTTTNSSLDKIPQVNFGDYSFSISRDFWINLVDTFTADSNYTHIVIGSFKRDSQPIINNIGGSDSSASYYVDDVIVEKITTGVHTIYADLVTYFSPNPFTTSTTFTFNNPQNKKHRIRIYNIQGRQIRKIENISTSEVKIEREDLSAGCYFYELKSEDGAVAKGKLFVQ